MKSPYCCKVSKYWQGYSWNKLSNNTCQRLEKDKILEEVFLSLSLSTYWHSTSTKGRLIKRRPGTKRQIPSKDMLWHHIHILPMKFRIWGLYPTCLPMLQSREVCQQSHMINGNKVVTETGSDSQTDSWMDRYYASLWPPQHNKPWYWLA